ncbi:MAG: hypothetical protein DRR16_18085 [Candidatus Parabeggiatoa sp. nov. 3]|nr:MAG: hypothetical protein DRR00_22685 [Gammaproteobacteria bacterium]RKZ62021.1 MAG: hypothetical protein DRQ99_19475 [Gammaproteobacteria bacterium]RKZ83122.1 MAG: hypothetical protein DRR16_18085 [Gammaproteobacteria bacterium]
MPVFRSNLFCGPLFVQIYFAALFSFQIYFALAFRSKFILRMSLFFGNALLKKSSVYSRAESNENQRRSGHNQHHQRSIILPTLHDYPIHNTLIRQDNKLKSV